MRTYKTDAHANARIEEAWDKEQKKQKHGKQYPARRGNNKMLRRLLRNQYRQEVRANRMKAIRGMAYRHNT